MISPRYAAAVAVLLAFAAVPTALNVYRAPEPIAAGSLAARLDGLGPAEPGRRELPWVKENFGAEDFVTRRYGDVDLFAARSWDSKKLFHFPELALTYGHSAAAREQIEVGGFPARLLTFPDTHSAYALFYGARPVRDPIPFLLAVLPERFLGRREPMTLIYVQGPDAARVKELLAAAGAAYLG